jgi:hypothetical protein
VHGRSAQRRYGVEVDRRLVPFALVLPVAFVVAVTAGAAGWGHEGRLVLSVLVLGPFAAWGALFALRVPPEPGPSSGDAVRRT